MGNLPPLKTHQFYTVCRKVFGIAELQKLFKVSPRQLYRWGADPDYTSDAERNPMDRYEKLLTRLVEYGRETDARAAVSRQAHIVGCELSCREGSDPDKQSVEAECLDDYPALTTFHAAIREHQPPEVVRHHWQNAKREIDETWELYLRSQKSVI